MARNIEELLKMESYQGMTDEEISLVMAYHAEQAAIKATLDVKTEFLREQQAAMIGRYVAAQTEANKAFDNAISTAAEFKAV